MVQVDFRAFRAHLKKGHIVAAPAEGVYGYCADPFNPQALKALLALKSREPGKGFIVLIGHEDQLPLVAAPLTAAQKKVVAAHWPGPVTCILPEGKNLSPLLTGGRGTVAVRWPKAAHMQAYLKAWGGPLVSTSANKSGQPPAKTCQEITKDIFCLPTPLLLNGQPSRILDVRTGQFAR